MRYMQLLDAVIRYAAMYLLLCTYAFISFQHILKECLLLIRCKEY